MISKTPRKVSITKIFTFDSAHKLNDYPGKCKNIHGHTYKLEVTVRGDIGVDGMVMDFHSLDEFVSDKILSIIDHKYLNEVFDFNPTAERLAFWIWEECAGQLNKDGVNVEKIVLWETPASYVTIT